MAFRSIREWLNPNEGDALRDLSFFRKRLINILGVCCLFLGAPVLMLAAYNRVQISEYPTALIYLTLVGVFVALVLLRERISIDVRATIFLGAIVLGSLVSLRDLGYATTAPISFISVVFLTSLLYGRLIGMGVAILICVVVVIVAYPHVLGTSGIEPQDTDLWIRYLIGFVASALGTAWIMGWVGTSLQRTIQQLSEQNAFLEKARGHRGRGQT
jgi:cell division protein FtsW (lipid II flippase)